MEQRLGIAAGKGELTEELLQSTELVNVWQEVGRGQTEEWDTSSKTLLSICAARNTDTREFCEVEENIVL